MLGVGRYLTAPGAVTRGHQTRGASRNQLRGLHAATTVLGVLHRYEGSAFGLRDRHPTCPVRLTTTTPLTGFCPHESGTDLSGDSRYRGTSPVPYLWQALSALAPPDGDERFGGRGLSIARLLVAADSLMHGLEPP